jgi:hypothetical protein
MPKSIGPQLSNLFHAFYPLVGHIEVFPSHQQLLAETGERVIEHRIHGAGNERFSAGRYDTLIGAKADESMPSRMDRGRFVLQHFQFSEPMRRKKVHDLLNGCGYRRGAPNVISKFLQVLPNSSPISRMRTRAEGAQYRESVRPRPYKSAS